MNDEEVKLDQKTQQLQAELDTKIGLLIMARGNIPVEKIRASLDALDNASRTLDPKYAFQVTVGHMPDLEGRLGQHARIQTQSTSEGFQHVFTVLSRQAETSSDEGVFFNILTRNVDRPDRIGVVARKETGLGTNLPLDKIRGIKIIPRQTT